MVRWHWLPPWEFFCVPCSWQATLLASCTDPVRPRNWYADANAKATPSTVNDHVDADRTVANSGRVVPFCSNWRKPRYRSVPCSRSLTRISY